ncbi:radical SAM/SPASM domain-containing protein [Nodosilinea sp. LEGE 07088]|uniref:radical SAM/SPASM domain-containing protein n=1 Tax=Nodosilinea sp. LEGE 07088 TaxID=2777968 RepID=UPI00187E4FF5|nr:radical SAM/SPASM domain-containing protein [Nodosilinea sp. LEGE 07088]MBE9141411.1 radical SAM/SPASM domain-containing protein [Nodosilinea sp. LEGE 07088]
MVSTSFLKHHFIAPDTLEERAALFAQSVSNVVVEITQHCNRQCSYCPVSGVDRLTNRAILPHEIFDQIIHDLESIEYDKSICLNLYNEPTADRPLLLQRIAYIRQHLPKSRIYFSTNGDFLTRDYLQAMVEAGLSELYVTLHPPKNHAYDDASAMTRFTEFSSRLGKGVKVHVLSPGHTIQGTLTLFNLKINVFTTNYTIYGSDRGGSVASLTNASLGRTSPCSRPFNDFTVSYDGTIFPCCQMFADNDVHQTYYSIGNIADFPDIFAAYASITLAKWRQDLLRFSPKASPCDTCSEDCRVGSEAEIAERDAVYRQFVGEIETPEPAQQPSPRRLLSWLKPQRHLTKTGQR